jgi:hypothetical protein
VSQSETGRQVDNAYLKAKLEDYKSLQELAPALMKVAQASETFTQKQYETRVLNDRQLLELTRSEVSKIRSLGAQCKAKEETLFSTHETPPQWASMTDEQKRQFIQDRSNRMDQAFRQNRQDCELSFCQQFLGDSSYAPRELLSRLHGDSFLSPRDRMKDGALDGLFAGPDPIDDSADYLEALGNKLQERVPTKK